MKEYTAKEMKLLKANPYRRMAKAIKTNNVTDNLLLFNWLTIKN